MNLSTAISKPTKVISGPGTPPATIRSWFWSEAALRRLAGVALVLGCLLRLLQYLLNRSLWLDEAYLALNILHRPWAGLLQPLDNHQGAPIIFLILEKSASLYLGSSEYALRLLPLLAGIVSVLLFYKLASKAVSGIAIPISLGLFAISPSLIYYSSELKQYSCDVAVALLLYFLAIQGSDANWKPLKVVTFGLAGAVAIWISHPATFVLAGIGATLAIALMAQKDWAKLLRLSPAFLMWVASLGACYAIALRKLAQDAVLLDYWKENFMPLPPRSVTEFKWFVDSFFGFFSGTAALQFAGLAAFVFLLGCISMYGHNRQRLFLLLSPVVPTLLASGAHKFPFGGRLALFLVPPALLLMAEGAAVIRAAAQDYLPAVGVVLVGLLFLDPGLYVLHHFAKPQTEIVRPGVMLPEEIKPVRAYLRTHEQPGDLIYVFSQSEPAWEYYTERDTSFPRGNVVTGTAAGHNLDDYESDLNRLRGHRAWVVVSHIHGTGANEAREIEFYLDAVGAKRLTSFTSAGAATYLYDLRGAAALPAAATSQ
jgi:hypothetical protein